MPIIVRKNDFGKMPAVMDAVLAAIVREHGQAVVRTAQQLVPVRTGALRESIKMQPMGPNEMTAFISAFGNEATGESYAAYVEFGTVRAAAQPFLTPAIELEKPRLLADLQNLEPNITVFGGVLRMSALDQR